MAGAISGATIASLIAMVGGTALQYKAAQDAAKKQQQAALAAQLRQNEFSQQAERAALDNAQDFNTDTRLGAQDQIEQQMAQEYIAPVESAQAINAGTTTTQGDVSKDYSSARAQSELNVMKNARMYAGLMAKANSAGRLRGNEAVKMGRTAEDIQRIGNFANGTGNVDRMGIEAAGRPNAGMMAVGQIAQGAGMMGMSGAFSGGSAGAVSNPGAGANGMVDWSLGSVGNPAAGAVSPGAGANGFVDWSAANKTMAPMAGSIWGGGNTRRG